MKKLICKLKGHTAGEYRFVRFFNIRTTWEIWCKRCNKKISYTSARARLVGEEIRKGFDGK